ncbi:transcription factor Opi1-domain-containing protein [Absidia repens]|uniref:Transcription factor Opi1-domain-containing protein n=1 Tax=Absidia repens TaxID=90262 RepID=A0A1X2IQ83_9FUNG|nr:transcription factor Opi1-domain-containing protein [Absidia repens]
MSQSPMSITKLCNMEQQQEQQTTQTSLGPHDPEVQLAAEALGDLANVKVPPIMLPPISSMSAPSTTPSSPAIATPSGSIQQSATLESSSSQQQQQHFMQRVSNHPFVHSALRAYESSKASSPVVKYGAEMVESIASPIYDKFGRQALIESQNVSLTPTNKNLETSRLVYYINSSFSFDYEYYPNEDDPTTAATTALANTSISDTQQQEISHRRGHKKSLSRSGSRSTSPHRSYTLSAKSPTTIHHHHQRPAVSRSRWKQLVVHAGAAAGTTAAVISEESMKCLKYCLSWLQYAAQHIDQQMTLLRNVLVSMATGSSSNSSSSSTTVSTHTNPAGMLAAIKKEVIETLRKVVEVISKYAGAGLPEQAKGTVRSFILALPSRWALLNSSTTPSSPITSPTLGPHASPHVQETSVKLLNFGSESVEMLQSVSTVFSSTIDRADTWLDRLHSVGVTRRSTKSSAAAAARQQRKSGSEDVMMETISEQDQQDQPHKTLSLSQIVNPVKSEPMEMN